MAQYKVLQDIEAEDKLVGPLTLRQFIYACITAVCLYVCFIAITKKVFFLLPVFLLPGALTAFFAFPWARDQPTEVWALAKIRFLLKPRRRIWNQSGVKQLVTITAPKRIEINYTNGLTQTEVKSRLRALADTIDSRGWATKNVTNGLYVQPIYGNHDSERLVDLDTIPQDVPTIDARSANDILDARTNPVAMAFDRMMRKSSQDRRAQIVQSMTSQKNTTTAQPPTTSPAQLPAPQNSGSPQPAKQQNDYWFMSQAPSTRAQIVAPGPTSTANGQTETDEEKALAKRLRKQNETQNISYAHLHTVLPLEEQRALDQKAAQAAAAAKAKQQLPQAPVTHQPDPAIIALASNNDLNVATIARQARQQGQTPPDEVVISLH